MDINEANACSLLLDLRFLLRQSLLFEHVFDLGTIMAIHKLDLIDSACHVAGMVTAGYVTEEYAVSFLVENAAQGDATHIADAVVRAQQNPDLIPMVVALLERAKHLVENPPPRRAPVTTT